jgi:signal transduction histidine kinase
MKPMLRSKRLSTQLVFWFLVVAAVPLVIEVTVISVQRSRLIKEEAARKLAAIRDLKVSKLDTWLDERLADIKTLAGDLHARDLGPLFREPGIAGTPGKEDWPIPRQAGLSEREWTLLGQVRQELDLYLEHSFDYREIFIVHPLTGRTLISTKPRREGIDRSQERYFTEPRRTRRAFVSDIHYAPRERMPVMELSIPILCRLHAGQHVAAVAVARVELRTSVYALLADRTGMGSTGETLLVDASGLVLSELRWRAGAPLVQRTSAEAARRAARGERGVMEALDYRGQRVLAAFAYVPKASWGLVAKQDLAELHAPIVTMVWESGGALLILTLLIALGAVLISGTIARPVLDMAEVARRIRGGDGSARSTPAPMPELGILGQALNEMADTLIAQASIRQAAVEIFQVMLAATSVPALGEGLLAKLLELTRGQWGAFYRGVGGHAFQRVAAIGLQPGIGAPFDAQELERRFGGAFAAGEICQVALLSREAMFDLGPAPGSPAPAAMLLVPLVVEGRVGAVLCLATSTRFPSEYQDLLARTWAAMTSAFANLVASEKTEALARELRAKNDAMEAVNRTLEAQAMELRALAAKLETQHRELEQANRVKSEFLSTMSHELRTPLNSVMALSQLMLARGTGKNPEQEREFLGIIERNGRHLLELVNAILDLSRIEAGQVAIFVGTVNAEDVVQSAMQTVRPLMADKGLCARVHTARGMPSFQSDEVRVRQILINLLSNAVKFTDTGEVEVSVETTADRVSFAVRDTGIGIEESDLDSIFDEFRQVDGSATRRHGGAGLGLTISRRLAEILGGTLTAKSAPGQGSVFTLSLPLPPRLGDEMPSRGRETRASPPVGERADGETRDGAAT